MAEDEKQEMDELQRKYPAIFRLAEELVLAFERIGDALEGIRVVSEKCQIRYFPDRSGSVREARVTRVPTEEERLRQAQGASEARDPTDWLSEFGDPEEIGIRERAFLESRRRNQSPQGQSNQGGSGGSPPETVER